MTKQFLLGIFLILLSACNSGGGGSSSGGGGSPTTPPVVNPGPTHSEETKSYSLQASQSVSVNLPNEGFSASIATTPSKGTFSGSYPNYTYTSLGGASGTDSVVLNLTKSGATKKLTLNFHINSIPYVADFSVSVPRGNVVVFDLEGADDDGDPLIYSIIQGPDTGSILWTPGTKQVTYEASNSAGSTSIWYTVSDGKATSATGRVTIIIASSVPTITSGNSLTVTEDVAQSFVVTANNATSYSISAQPSHGAITGSNGSYSYIPALNYFGSDSFKVRAINAEGAFAEKVVTVTVNPVNDAPVLADIGITTPEDTEAFVILEANDVDSTVLNYNIVSYPSKGTAWRIADRLFYSPNYREHGSDLMSVRVCDNGAPILCDDAFVNITITDVIQEPIAYDQEVAVTGGESVSINITGVVENPASVNVNIINTPTKGTLTHIGGMEFSYTPHANEDGESSATDYFTFVLIEGGLTSEPAVVTLSINYPFNYLQFNIEGGFKKMSALNNIFHQDEVGSSHYYFMTKEIEIAEDNTLTQALIGLDKDELICPNTGTQYLLVPLFSDPSSMGEVFTASADYACSDLKSSYEEDMFYATSDLILRQVNDDSQGMPKTFMGLNKDSLDNNTSLAGLNSLELNNFELVRLDLVSKAKEISNISSFSSRLVTTTIEGQGSANHLFIKSNEVVNHYLNPTNQLQVYHLVEMEGSELKLKEKFYLSGSQMKKLQTLLDEWYLAEMGEAPEEGSGIKEDAGRILILGDVIMVRLEQEVTSLEYFDEEDNANVFEYKVLGRPILEIYNRKP